MISYPHETFWLEGETEHLYVVPSTNLRVQYSFRAKIQSLKEMESQFQTWSLVGRSVSDFWSKTWPAEISRPHNNTSKEKWTLPSVQLADGLRFSCVSVQQNYENYHNIFSTFDLFPETPSSRPISYSQTTPHLPIHNSINAHHLSNSEKVALYSHYTNLQTGMAWRTGQ